MIHCSEQGTDRQGPCDEYASCVRFDLTPSRVAVERSGMPHAAWPLAGWIGEADMTDQTEDGAGVAIGDVTP